MNTFIEEVAATAGGANIKSCIQCGICSGSCPMAGEMEYPPRKIIAMVRAGMRDEVLSSNAMWHCLSCYLCTARCPRGVKPTEIAHALESLAVQNGYRSRGTDSPRMYRNFVMSINDHGRVHELGAMMKYYLRGNPLNAVKMLPVALNLLTHKRMPLRPEKTRGSKELSNIIRKFREVQGKS